jgi:hypothetical protein
MDERTGPSIYTKAGRCVQKTAAIWRLYFRRFEVSYEVIEANLLHEIISHIEAFIPRYWHEVITGMLVHGCQVCGKEDHGHWKCPDKHTQCTFCTAVGVSGRRAHRAKVCPELHSACWQCRRRGHRRPDAGPCPDREEHWRNCRNLGMFSRLEPFEYVIDYARLKQEALQIFGQFLKPEVQAKLPSLVGFALKRKWDAQGRELKGRSSLQSLSRPSQPARMRTSPTFAVPFPKQQGNSKQQLDGGRGRSDSTSTEPRSRSSSSTESQMRKPSGQPSATVTSGALASASAVPPYPEQSTPTGSKRSHDSDTGDEGFIEMKRYKVIQDALAIVVGHNQALDKRVAELEREIASFHGRNPHSSSSDVGTPEPRYRADTRARGSRGGKASRRSFSAKGRAHSASYMEWKGEADFSGQMPVATFRAGFLRRESGLRIPDLSLSGATAQPAGVRPLHGHFDDDDGFNAFSPKRSVAKSATDAESTGNSATAAEASVKGAPPRDLAESNYAAPPGVFFANTTKGKATGRFRGKKSGSASGHSGPSSAQ